MRRGPGGEGASGEGLGVRGGSVWDVAGRKSWRWGRWHGDPGQGAPEEVCSCRKHIRWATTISTAATSSSVALALQYRCLGAHPAAAALSLVSHILLHRSPFLTPTEDRGEAERARRALAAPGGGGIAAGQQSDHLLLVAAYELWRVREGRGQGGRDGREGRGRGEGAGARRRAAGASVRWALAPLWPPHNRA